MLRSVESRWQYAFRQTVGKCPVCQASLTPFVKCILGEGCLLSPWADLHLHAVCFGCNGTILISSNTDREVCYVSHSSVYGYRRSGNRR